jgi:tRNA threonylcarbamoyladenosine biosynthesis protein TsaB
VNRLLLAVDTTHEFGSLALLRGGETLEEVLVHSPEGYGHILYGHIAGLLRRHSADVRSLDAFAAASGPGSFTGVRIGLACVKGLGEALAKPVVPVSNLAAMASFGAAAFRAPVLDARRGEVYGAVYDARGKIVAGEVVAPFPEWLASLPEDVEFVATDFGPFETALAGTRFAGARVVTAPRALAAAVGRIALGRLSAGEACHAIAAEANYVRRSDAELFWKE